MIKEKKNTRVHTYSVGVPEDSQDPRIYKSDKIIDPAPSLD